MTATTQSANDNSTKLATTAYVDGKAPVGFASGMRATGTNTTFSLPNTTVTTLPFNSTTWDLNTEYNNSTYTFTAKQAGYYQVNASIYFVTPSSGSFNQIQIFVNGFMLAQSSAIPGSTNDVCQPVSTIVKLNTNDAVTIVAYQNSGGAKVVYMPNCSWSMQRVY